MTTDDALVERMVVAMHTDDIRRGRAFLPLDEMDPLARESYYDNARALLPEVRKAQAEALREAATDMRSDKDPGHWNLRVNGDPEHSASPDAWLEYRADRIRAEREGEAFSNIAAGLQVWWFHADGSVHATCTEHPEWGDSTCGSPDEVMARYAEHLVTHHAINPGGDR